MSLLSEWWNGRRPGDPNPAALTDPISKQEAIAVSTRTVTRRRLVVWGVLAFLILSMMGGLFGWDFITTKEESWLKTRTSLESKAEEWKTKWANSEARAESWQKAATSRKRVKVSKRPLVLDLGDRKVVDYSWDWDVLESGTSNEGGASAVTVFSGAEASGNSTTSSAVSVMDQGHKKDEKKAAWRFSGGPAFRFGEAWNAPTLNPLDRVGIQVGGRCLWRLGGTLTGFKDQVVLSPQFFF